MRLMRRRARLRRPEGPPKEAIVVNLGKILERRAGILVAVDSLVTSLTSPTQCVPSSLPRVRSIARDTLLALSYDLVTPLHSHQRKIDSDYLALPRPPSDPLSYTLPVTSSLTVSPSLLLVAHSAFLPVTPLSRSFLSPAPPIAAVYRAAPYLTDPYFCFHSIPSLPLLKRLGLFVAVYCSSVSFLRVPERILEVSFQDRRHGAPVFASSGQSDCSQPLISLVFSPLCPPSCLRSQLRAMELPSTSWGLTSALKGSVLFLLYLLSINILESSAHIYLLNCKKVEGLRGSIQGNFAERPTRSEGSKVSETLHMQGELPKRRRSQEKSCSYVSPRNRG